MILAVTACGQNTESNTKINTESNTNESTTIENYTENTTGLFSNSEFIVYLPVYVLVYYHTYFCYAIITGLRYHILEDYRHSSEGSIPRGVPLNLPKKV